MQNYNNDELKINKTLERIEHTESKIKKDTQNKTEELEEELPPREFPHLSLHDLNEILSLTIKSDDHNKVATFFCMLSAFTEDSQFNIAFSAPSSSGKSYIPLQISKLFPQKSITTLGYASPTSFFHDNIQKSDNEFVVDLERKILIFLDMPHYQLLEKIRPVMSHDKKEVTVKITDRTKRLRAKNIIIRGYPSVVFCSTKLEMDEQENTRFMILSPLITQDKIRQSILEKIKKESDNKSYEEWVNSDSKRKELIERIKYIKAEKINEILIKKELHEKISKIFISKSVLKPRDSRDVSRLISLVKSTALLNLWERRTDKPNEISADESDLEEALKIWSAISESQDYNLPPYLLDIYKKIILSLFGQDGRAWITRQEILAKHIRVYGRPLSDDYLRKEILPMFESAGLIYQYSEEHDRRNKVIALVKDSNFL